MMNSAFFYKTKQWNTPTVWFYFTHVTGGIPEKVFKRQSRLAFTEIISYKADPNFKWFALTGLEPQVNSTLNF